MAYPGEPEYQAYMQYKMQQETNGQPSVPIDQWRQMQQPQPPQQGQPQAPQGSYIQNLIRSLKSK